jgi:hypothetical protein
LKVKKPGVGFEEFAPTCGLNFPHPSPLGSKDVSLMLSSSKESGVRMVGVDGTVSL